MPALQNALALLPDIAFGEKDTLLPTLVSLNDTIIKLQAESLEAYKKRKPNAAPASPTST